MSTFTPRRAKRRVWSHHGEPYPLTHQEALKSGSAVYFTGKPCQRGHLYWRNTSSRSCLECRREDAAARRREPKLIYGDDMARFMSYVEPIPESGCWIMGGHVASHGYGLFSVGRNTVRAHRWAYEAFIGPIPKGRVVCHKCDVRCCVNPDHLFIGTQRDNIADKVAKDRQAKGERMAAAKLTEDDVREIRAIDLSPPGRKTEVADFYGVSRKVIYNITNGLSWGHVDA